MGAAQLYTQEFYETVVKAKLNPGGIFVTQSGPAGVMSASQVQPQGLGRITLPWSWPARGDMPREAPPGRAPVGWALSQDGGHDCGGR